MIVTGEAGIGKSRLMAEWHRSLGKDVRWLEGRSYAGNTGVPYGPFADLSRRYAGITDEDSEARARSRLRQGLHRVLPGGLEADALVASMLGMRLQENEANHLADLTPQAIRERLFALVEDLIRRLARQRPTILAMEDLHWADDSSMELIQHLLPLVREVPLTIVGVFRRGEGDVPLLPIATEQYADRLTHLELLPLERESAVSLVEELLAGAESLPASVRDLIVGKAEGNPFFVEEVIRTLIERGGLERSADGDGWVVTPQIEGVTVPDTLQGVLMARLDRLEPDTRRTAQEAAVIGRIFQERVLERLADDVARLESELEHLEREELIRELRRDPELEYIFKHALTQEVAYETLSAAQRRDLHARVGLALEELVGDRIGEFQAILGGHFLRGEIWDKAYAYYLAAGDAARTAACLPGGLSPLRRRPSRRSPTCRRPTTSGGSWSTWCVQQMVVSWGAEDPGRNLAKLAEAEAVAQALPAADGGPGTGSRAAGPRPVLDRPHPLLPRRAARGDRLLPAGAGGRPGAGRPRTAGHSAGRHGSSAGGAGPLRPGHPRPGRRHRSAREGGRVAGLGLLDCLPRGGGHGDRQAGQTAWRSTRGRGAGEADEEPDHPGRLPTSCWASSPS